MSVCRGHCGAASARSGGSGCEDRRGAGVSGIREAGKSGLSVGISKVEKSGDLPEALRYAACFDRRLLVEKGLSCREIETAVLGNGDDVSAAVTGEIVATEDFYDYDAKYVDDGKPKMQIPAHIPEEISERIREYAVRGFQMLGGEGFARCDFFVDRADGKIYLNEINTIPGFTSFSMFPLLWSMPALHIQIQSKGSLN